MNALLFTRIAFVALATFVSYKIGLEFNMQAECMMIGFVGSLLFVLLELCTDILPPKNIFMALAGLLLGLVIASLIYRTIPERFLEERYSLIVCNLVFGYFCTVFALKNADRIDLSALNLVGHSAATSTSILDTSVIIDGRIKDLIVANFVQGTIVVPSFVLYELQALADSRDSRKRVKGRRGIEMLEVIKTFDAKLTVYEQDYPNIPEVDLKLIQLAKELNGQILTTDFNLYKVALLHQARALNINELANVLKPATHIGDTVRVYISKEGKEPGQGVGYLEDGTMVVVDDGAGHMREEIETNVTQILQTSAGRMVFARPIEEENSGGGGGGDSRKESGASEESDASSKNRNASSVGSG